MKTSDAGSNVDAPSACPVKDKLPSTASGLAGLMHKLPTESSNSNRHSNISYDSAINDIQVGQGIQDDQIVSLSTTRPVSSIPKTEIVTPEHQPNGLDRWVYPSEQQYYNAMRKKLSLIHI